MLKVVIDVGKSIQAQDRQQQIKQMLLGGIAFSRNYFIKCFLELAYDTGLGV